MVVTAKRQTRHELGGNGDLQIWAAVGGVAADPATVEEGDPDTAMSIDRESVRRDRLGRKPEVRLGTIREVHEHTSPRHVSRGTKCMREHAASGGVHVVERSAIRRYPHAVGDRNVGVQLVRVAARIDPERRAHGTARVRWIRPHATDVDPAVGIAAQIIEYRMVSLKQDARGSVADMGHIAAGDHDAARRVERYATDAVPPRNHRGDLSTRRKAIDPATNNVAEVQVAGWIAAWGFDQPVAESKRLNAHFYH